MLSKLFKKSGVTQQEVGEVASKFPQVVPLRNSLLKRSYVVRNLTTKMQVVVGVDDESGGNHFVLNGSQEKVVLLFPDEVERLEHLKVAYGGEWQRVFEVKLIKRVAR